MVRIQPKFLLYTVSYKLALPYSQSFHLISLLISTVSTSCYNITTPILTSDTTDTPDTMALPFTPTIKAELKQFSDRLVKLPRKIRNMIFGYVVRQDTPINLNDTAIGFSVMDSTLLELQEAAYKNNAFSFTILPPIRKLPCIVHNPDIFFGADGSNSDSEVEEDSEFCNCAVITDPLSTCSYEEYQFTIWGVHFEYKKYIQHLIVVAEEIEVPDLNPHDSEICFTKDRPRIRTQWKELLDLPCLQNLTVQWEKTSLRKFTWADFAPVIRQLRSTRPKLHLTFNMSYESLILKNHGLRSSLVSYSCFKKMSSSTLSANITELFDPPTEEDGVFARDDVEKERQTPVYAILGTLVNRNLNESGLRSTLRNFLIGHPAYRRVELDEHWKVYQKVKEGSHD